MNRKKLARIKGDLDRLVQSPRGRKASEFVALALKLGRVKVNRGKEPTYVRTETPPFAFPLTIPNHPGDISIGTAKSIIDQLLDDHDVLDQWLDQLESRADTNVSETDPDSSGGDQS